MTEHRVSYTLDSTLETVDSAEQAAGKVATEAGFDEDEVMRISMAVREAAVNAVLHGNAYDPGKKVSTRQVDGVTIVDCSGRITLGEGSVMLKDTVRELLSKGQKRILLNLGDVNYIDSSGIGELVSAFTTVRNQGGELKLLNLTKKVHDLLQITKLYTVFDVKDEEAAAVKSFA